MTDFWTASGFHLLTRDADNHLAVTPDFLRAYLLRPEMRPPEEACDAERTLPLGAKATVTNQENGKSVDVIVNDRGPYVDGRVIDLSRSAAKKLDMIDDGTAPVKVEVKPSEQPTDTAREKVEEKVDQLTPGNQVAQGEGNRNSGNSGGNRSDTVSHSGSGK